MDTNNEAPEHTELSNAELILRWRKTKEALREFYGERDGYEGEIRRRMDSNSGTVLTGVEDNEVYRTELKFTKPVWDEELFRPLLEGTSVFTYEQLLDAGAITLVPKYNKAVLKKLGKEDGDIADRVERARDPGKGSLV